MDIRTIMSVVVSFVLPVSLQAETITLNPESYTEITFDGIPATKYAYQDDILSIQVNKSSSALILPFDKIKQVSQVSFAWQLEGDVKTKDAAHEKTKGGDDFPLRIGLCLYGDAPMVPFFAPAWIKKISSIMKHPSDKLIYFVVGAHHTAGQSWESPYSDSMELHALGSQTKDGWQLVQHDIGKKLKAVGLWIMGDGDNTDSKFRVQLKSLQLK